MLLANKKVAAYASRGGKYEKEVSPAEPKGKKQEGKTFVYRIHDLPDSEKMESFTRFIRQVWAYNESPAIGPPSSQAH